MTAQDKELFSQLYDRNYKRLLYAAIRIAHNPFTAEELTNEAFTILLTHFDRVDIAEYLRISHEASRARLSRAKQHYAHLLAKERLM